MRELYRRLKRLDKKDRVIFYLLFTCFIDIVFALTKGFLGLITPSLWFGANAGFYFIISIARFFSIKYYRKMRLENNDDIKKKIAYNNYFGNGILLIMLGVSYLIISIIMYNKDSVSMFFNGYFKDWFINFHFIYLVAFMSFYKLGTAIYGMIKYKRKNNPIISAVKMTNYAEGLTAIVSTQVALLYAFGESGRNYSLFNALTGGCMSIGIIIMGIYMVRTKMEK